MSERVLGWSSRAAYLFGLAPVIGLLQTSAQFRLARDSRGGRGLCRLRAHGIERGAVANEEIKET